MLRECQLQTDIQHAKRKWRGIKAGKEKLKVKKVPEYVTMRKETGDLSIRSWLCSTQVGSSSAANLRLGVRSGYEPDIRRYVSIQFIHSFIIHSFDIMTIHIDLIHTSIFLSRRIFFSASFKLRFVRLTLSNRSAAI